jgi:uncharacterized protein YbbK (DUF523 family)
MRIGVSACLLGQRVRWDGDHKRDGFLCDELAPRVEFVPVCPEVELGLGTPRPPIRLEGRRLVMPSRGLDLTESMRDFAARRVAALEKEGLSGYVLKSGSPSCGPREVKVHRGARVTRDGVGFFAQALRAHFPSLPIEDEARLADPRVRASFLARVEAYDELSRLRWTPSAVRSFHAAHEALLRPAAFRALSSLLARPPARDELRERYTAGFMKGLRAPPRPARR